MLLLLHGMPATAAPVDINADQMTRGADGVVIATGHVIIKRPSETLIADEVTYRTKEHIMEARGHVVIRSPQATIHADSAQIQTQSKTGNMQHATITMPSGERLQAENVKRIDDQRFEADHILYSTCPADEESWRIAASHALLDNENGTLTTTHPRLELWQVPVLYAPWWKQSLRRKSGLLMPSFGSGKRRGTELAVPYYFAPYANWDATLTPHWMSARGVMGEAELRHVSTFGHEKLNAAGIHDTVTGRLRGRLEADVQWQLPADTQFNISADHISDRDYLADYGGNAVVSSRYLQSSATLSQQMQVADTRTNWFLQAQHMQDLLLTSNATTLQILPRLQSSSQWQALPNLIAHFDQQTTRFDRRTGVTGWRMDLHPYIELPWESEGGGISATLSGGVRHTRYWLQQTALTNSRPTRTAEEASLEVRSDFERIGSNRDWRHVISPIFRYDYINAPNQSALPNFDSGFALVSWSNLLSGNRFSGYDRIENTNRVSMVLENRLQTRDNNSDAARDMLTVRAGAAYDISRNTVDAALKKVPIHPLSNLLGEMIWQPATGIALYGSGQYNPFDRYWSTINSYISLTGIGGNSLYAGYSFTDARYSTRTQMIYLNGSIHLKSRWQATANWQYDTLLKLSQQTTLGLQYKHPCWTAGVEAYRINRRSGTTTASNFGFRILLEFKGLGSVGS
ncbi:LPS-assembly protein LptD [Mariprofundus ferrooxydans]|uniref:LPS-assembly protein LptD n=1 Tax=Mariprofundus ferrooxydans TaxID=314344 RepID=UPI0014315FB5|nr:LPS assembly protein LptD [Mariprofundus ferrooxydans]